MLLITYSMGKWKKLEYYNYYLKKIHPNNY